MSFEAGILCTSGEQHHAVPEQLQQSFRRRTCVDQLVRPVYRNLKSGRDGADAIQGLQHQWPHWHCHGVDTSGLLYHSSRLKLTRLKDLHDALCVRLCFGEGSVRVGLTTACESSSCIQGAEGEATVASVKVDLFASLGRYAKDAAQGHAPMREFQKLRIAARSERCAVEPRSTTGVATLESTCGWIQ